MNTVGVREISRLISRLRHRQFGILVTTSVIARQGYEEVREDRHPIIFITGKDITEVLIQNGHNSPENVQEWLSAEFPRI
jgi:ABC-type lipopolysaccharide export system ATPase subunit